MKLQLAELTLEKKEGSEQNVLQRLKVGCLSRSYLSMPSNQSRIYDLFCTNTSRRVRMLGIS